MRDFWPLLLAIPPLLLILLAIIVSNVDRGQCLASHDEPLMQMVPIGQIMIPMFTTQTVCDRWEFPEGRPK